MRAVLAAAALAVAGCMAQPQVETAQVDPYAETRDSACYSVDLFTRVRVTEPAPEVPAAWRRFSGRWGGGKWNGAWCHDLYVLDIAPDGRVRVVETYAPHEPWGKRATAFTRTGVIGEDGRLRLRYGATSVEYRIEGDELFGVRDETLGRMVIAMERRSV